MSKTRKRPRRQCPACGSQDLVEILHGMPTTELGEAAERGEVELGGCMVVDEPPTRRCRGCGCAFGARRGHLGGLGVLFVCGRNQWRSPTAERIFSRREDIQVRSRGLASSARRQVTAKDVVWADLIFVMEAKHRDRLLSRFAEQVESRRIHVLDIPDEYRFMDPELVRILMDSVTPVLEGHR